MQIAHLHLHTQYSLLDGANKISEVLKLAKSKGQPAMAITDHGNMHGAIEFYAEAKKIGIKPIIGCELYVTSGSRLDRRPKEKGGAPTYHLTVLAKDFIGYQNLCRLVTLAYREGFYFKPRVDHELLERYSKGLIALSGCMSGELFDFISDEKIDKASELVKYYSGVFEDQFFLEIQPHLVADQIKHNKGCIELAKQIGLPVVVTNDCHYSQKDDHSSQEVLMCISTGKLITDKDRIRHDGFELYLKSADDVLKGLSEFSIGEEAIRNTLEIANQCNVNFEFDKFFMPQFDPVIKPDEATLSEIMATSARKGLEERLKGLEKNTTNWNPANRPMYIERLEEEIRLISKMGFAGYFLVVSDFVVWAKENGIPVGPGRGSAAGSLVAYAMRITDIDPIPHKLLFERFLNPERVSMPDIDVDFCIYGRDRVIKYVVEKYGKENVAQICTFGTLKAKAAIKDVGRALGLSYAETDRVAQLVPAPRQGFDYSLAEAMEMEKRLKEYAAKEGRELISHALKLEGLTRHTSTHAAGVVIGDRPLIDLLPLMIDKDGNEVTQYSMKYVEKIGLVKFDFLGLKTLTVIDTAQKLVEENRGVKIDFQYLPLDDPKSYSILCSGNTTGIFQLESTGIRDVTVRLKPSCFDDLVAILALYRPGPLDAGMVDHYIERKHGREPVSYLHPKMKNILSDTYGIIVYQEQIMQLARELAGYTLGGADLLRRAMGKKIPEEMAKQRQIFIEGTTKNGITRKLAEEIFDQMETFGRYGFNRSHSAAYALVSYQTAYLKAHYPVEFMAALMTHEMGDSDKTLKNLNECRERKIEVLPPDVNLSASKFSVQEDKVRYGLEAVKGLGEKAAQAIIEARDEKGKFEDLEDFASKVDSQTMNRKVVESLVKCGAFDFSGVSRREMYENLDDVLKLAQSLAKDRNTNQFSLFGESVNASFSRKRINLPEWPINKKLAHEREALGFYISGHPLLKLTKDLKRVGALTTSVAHQDRPPQNVKIGGVITALKLKNTKKGNRYATFTLEDWLGTIETIVWPDLYVDVHTLLTSEDPVVVTGRLDVSEERKTLVAEKMESLFDLRDRNATQGVLELDETVAFERNAQALLSVLSKHSGPCPVKVKLLVDNAQVSMVLKDKKNSPVCVNPSEALCDEVEQLFGKPVLSFL